MKKQFLVMLAVLVDQITLFSNSSKADKMISLNVVKKNFLFSLLTFVMLLNISNAQNYQPTPNDTLKSTRISSDLKITFSVYAPMAQEVKLGGSDIPGLQVNNKMNKQENGVWTITVGPLEAGAYRYNFVIDKVTLLDPRNNSISESNANSWSMVYVPGNDFMDLKDVQHGAISEINYSSKSLQRFRRMHIYTPPGYEAGSSKYPVLYLLHGAFDCDDSWSTVGRAGFIIDNLLAEKKVVPMIVVMPAGHTGPFTFGAPSANRPRVDEFEEDFLKDIKPYVENNYRVLNDRSKRAIAGLSMGGAQTLNIAIPNLGEYGYFGVFSSGVFSLRGNNAFGANAGPSWEETNLKMLGDLELKKDLKLVWFATGKEDFLLETSRATVELLKKHGFDVIYKETNGAHTWNKWRDYLYEFSQLLFK